MQSEATPNLINEPVEIGWHGYRIGMSSELSESILIRLATLLPKQTSQHGNGLLGRSGQRGAMVEGLGRVFVKRYARGGVLRKIIRDWYAGHPGRRSRAEFEMLNLVRSVGLNAPRPIAYFVQGRFLYRTWLVMEEISDSSTLAEIGQHGGEEELVKIFDRFIEQLEILIRNGIYHVDLHPGNVLVTRDERVFLIDFDKARKVNWNQYQLRDAYLRRWRRAVIKHNLSPVMNEIMSLRLRSFEECLVSAG